MTNKYSLISLFLLIAVNFFSQKTVAQGDCNKLGAWLWYIEISGFGTHARLADSLKSIGVKRIYVKVSDGKPNPAVWPELLDKSVVSTYTSRGLEVWAWSYNYPGNEVEQATALRIAAETGYQGFVVDVESEFDNKAQGLRALFSAFAEQRDWVRSNLPGKSQFSLYCTTWGNPTDHKFSIKDIDPFVDGYKPQTYVENWGGIYYTNMAYWIRYGTDEYRQLGATKPVHHIVSTEKGVITPEKINEFFQISGPESSIWVVPGQNTSPTLWNSTWRKVNWRMNFCSSTEEVFPVSGAGSTIVFPNPAIDQVQIQSASKVIGADIYSSQGKKALVITGDQFSVAGLSPGIYLVRVTHEGEGYSTHRLLVPVD